MSTYGTYIDSGVPRRMGEQPGGRGRLLTGRCAFKSGLFSLGSG